MIKKMVGVCFLFFFLCGAAWAKGPAATIARDNRQAVAAMPGQAPAEIKAAESKKGAPPASPAAAAATAIPPAAAVKPAEPLPPSDSDLDGKPEAYRKRVIAFRTLIRQEPTRETKIKKATALLNDNAGPYRADAILFLSEVKAEGVLDDLWKTAREDVTLRGHVAVAYGEMEDPAAIPYLIKMLASANPNVRSSAARSLVKLSGQDLGYDADDSEAKRQEIIAKYSEWWKANKSNLKKKPAPTEQDKEAEEKWRLYGLPYLEKPAAGGN